MPARSALTLALLLAASLACSTTRDGSAQEVSHACIIMAPEGLEDRLSPRDSMTFQLAGERVTVCYGRPSARGRTMLGGVERYGELWRTGADEPTMIHTSVPLELAGIAVEPGIYSLYTVPGPEEWQIIVNRAIDQWGHERYYTEEVAAKEVARATVPREEMEEHVEMLTFRVEPRSEGRVDLLLEWENTRVRIPVSASS